MVGQRLQGLLVLAICVACAWAPAFLVPAVAPDETQLTPALGRRAGQPLSKAAPADIKRRAGPPVEGPGSFGLFCRSALAAACAFVASAANRRMQQKRSGSVLMRYFPSACSTPRQKVLRRLEVFGEIPAWSRRPLIKRRLKLPWRTRQTPKLSYFGRYLVEKQRVRYHYNVKDKQLKFYVMRAFRRGVDYPIDNLMQQLESRLDNYVWRVGLAPTMAAARHFVREGHIQYKTGSMTDFRTINIPSCRLKVGDQVRVKPKWRSQQFGKRNQEDEGPVTMPQHITWDRETMTGSYDDVCDVAELGIDVNEDHLVMRFTGPFGLRQKHVRYYEGTNKVIKNKYNGGKPRSTPENMLNMKRGIGLNKRGRKRPPALWGRRNKPLNNPWETTRSLRV